MSSAPIKKLPASPSVGLPGVPVPDRGREKINVGFSDFEGGYVSHHRAEERTIFLSLCGVFDIMKIVRSTVRPLPKPRF
jgi:hypothetical protein